MHQEHIKAILEGVIPELKGAIVAAQQPLLDRIDALEKRAPEKGEPGEPGKPGKEGSSVTLDDVRPLIAEAVAAIPAPKDGASVTVDDLRPIIEELVAAIPKPNDGKSITLEDVRPVIEEEIAKIPVPKDGVGLAGALIDRSGALVLTLSDGTQKELGVVVGQNGNDGAPGLGFEDMTEEFADDGRTLIRRYTRGEQTKEFRHTFAVVLDRGVWKAGTFQKGDGVTLGGQYFIAQRETSAEPMTPGAKDDWRLAVKKGRDGKDFKPDGDKSGGPVRFK